MKHIVICLSLLSVLMLSSCVLPMPIVQQPASTLEPAVPASPSSTPSAPTVEAPAATLEPTAPAAPTPTPAPSAVPLSFVPAVYKDEANGFELDYPTDWSVDPNSQLGSRGSQARLLSPGTTAETLAAGGSQARLLSPGTTAETLAAGGSRLSVTVFLWDPKNDLAAFVTDRRAAWDASGFSIIKQAEGDLVDGRKEMDFVAQAPDGSQAFFLFTTVGEDYLQVAGEGDLTLIGEIAHTVRPLNFQP